MKRKGMATGENFTIDQFTGADVNEAKCWVSKFELYCKFKKFNDATKLAVFPLRLADTCFDWYQTLNDDIKNDYELLKAAFLKRYGPDVRTSFERKKMLWKKQQAPSQGIHNHKEDDFSEPPLRPKEKYRDRWMKCWTQVSLNQVNRNGVVPLYL